MFAPYLLALFGIPTVSTVGTMKAAMHEGKIGAVIQTSALTKQPHLYAIGPLEGMRGEVTVIDGLVSIGSVKAGAPTGGLSSNAGAPFLVYSYVDQWTAKKQVSAANLETLARLIQNQVKGAERFAFLIEATVTAGQFHIVDYNGKASDFDMKAHKDSQRNFPIKNTPGTLIGFFTNQESDAGVFVHMGEKIHVHFVSKDGTMSGHLDSATFAPGWILKTPAN